MKKTVISAAIVSVGLAGFRGDMDKAGDWYDKHQGAVDGAAETAAKIGKILAYQNDNQFDFKSDMDKAGDWYDNHQGAVDGAVTTAATIGKILAAQNDNEFGVKQRAEFMAKHGRTIAKIASMLGDANDNQFDFKSDMDKTGDWYDNHQGAVDDTAITAAKIGKILAAENEFGIKQRAEFVAKHGRTIAKIASMLGDANDIQLDFQSAMDGAGNWYDNHQGAVDGAVTTAATVAKILAYQNDNQFDFKNDMDKAGDWYKDHQGAVDGAITTAATVGKILAYENDVNEHLRNNNNLKSLKGLEAPRRRGFLGN